MANPRFQHLREDLTGGAVSASVAIPLALGYGMFAFVALGEAYFAFGVVAGLLSATVVGFVSVLLGDPSRAVYAPRIVTTFFIGALLRGLLQSHAPFFANGDGELYAVVLLLIILLAGFFQFLFGWMRMGTLLKHTPQPVLAGFQNAAAILLLLAQLSNVLGVPRQTPLLQLFGALDLVKPLTLLVGAAAFAGMWYGRRLLPKIPPVITGLFVGASVYYLLRLAGFASQLGPVIGEGKFFSFGMLALPQFLQLAARPHLPELLPSVVSGALGLAFIASLDALLCARILEGGSGIRTDGNRQLVRLGLGNMLAASMGAITSGLNLGPSLANRAYGAKTPVSALVNAGLVLLTILLLLPVLAWLPRSVLSGVIMAIAIQHLDASTLPTIGRLLTGKFSARRSMAIDLAVTLLVTVLAIFVDIVTAVFIGIFLAMTLFVLRLSRSVVRTSFSGDIVSSRKLRDPADALVLAQHAQHIHVLVLEGALFFGTADRLFAAIDAVTAQGARCVILDLRHVSDIDSTGARLLLEMFQKLRKQGIPLLLSHLNPDTAGSRMLADVGLLAALAPDKLWHDTDRAIEWAEDWLIQEANGAPAHSQQALIDQPLFDGLSEQQRALACAAFVTRSFKKGAVLFRQGDPGADMFVIGSGSASVHLPDRDGGTIRLVTFAAGTLFGEIALLDQQPRSATVIADGDLECHVLEQQAFEQLKQDSPALAIALLQNLAKQLSTTVRNSNRTIYHLAH